MKMAGMITVGIDVRLIGKQRTGDEVVFFQLVRELIQRRDNGIRYELFTDESTDDRLASLRLKLEALGREDIEIVPLAAKNRFHWNAVALPWRLFRSPVDVFHTQYILPLFLPRQLKVVTHIHDISFRVHPEWIGAADRLFLSLFIPRTLRRSDRLLVPSKFTRDELMSRYGVPGERIVVIENAAAEEWLIPVDPDEIRRVAEKYALTPGQYLLSSGTMQPRKNIPFLIEAFREAVRTRRLGLKLALTGSLSGHNVDANIGGSGEESGIIYTGYVSDEELRALVAGAAGYVFPSLYEGFGIPIEEALAQGTPVLASDIPVFREIGGDRLVYFDPTSLAGLTETLYNFSIDISSGKRRKERPTGGERAYSWTKSAAALAGLYRALADASR